MIPVEGLPLPLDVRVTAVKVTVEALGLPTTNWATGVLATPGSWVESDGAAGPAETLTETGVGVEVLVKTEVLVKVKVFVFVNVGVDVLVLVGVDVFVKVRVGVKLFVNVNVFVGVLVGG